jgi:hypothetical protein
MKRPNRQTANMTLAQISKMADFDNFSNEVSVILFSQAE